jgi:hypothetical protein
VSGRFQLSRIAPDGRADFRRMMTDSPSITRNSIRFAFDFEAPVDTG